MKKEKSIWYCTECGNEFSKWVGKCSACGSWNTLVEEKVDENVKTLSSLVDEKVEVKKIKDAKSINFSRIKSGFSELDRVLGGGFVQGSLILLGGEPGIGKSTLILQITDKIDMEDKILYISGEESLEQIKLRADRLEIEKVNLYFLGETDLNKIELALEEIKPSFLIMDSIQTIYSPEISSAPGSVSQVREVTSQIMRLCKKKGITSIIVGHVTKDGNIAGPRVLEHMVDTVLYIEGERYFSYRIIRAVKNRFGSTNEIGMFEMEQEGLREITNPSGVLLENRSDLTIGTAIAVSIEGTRPILLEIQSLTTPTLFGMPRRNAIGVDYNRVTLLMAVIEKYTNLTLNNQDVYINIAGGIKINEPSLDLALIMSTASSYVKKSIPLGIAFVGEVGLTGEVRAVNMIDKRIKESEKLGFKEIVIPYYNYKNLKNNKYNIKINPVKNIKEVLKILSAEN